MIDRALITRKLALIVADLKALLPFARESLDDFLTNPLDEVVTERYLERIIGRMIDVNYHLITEAGSPPPRDYYQSFTQLGTLGILPPALARQIAACAGLRNRLVHEYDEIDPARVHEAAGSAVRDVPEYLRLVGEHIERSSS